MKNTKKQKKRSIRSKGNTSTRIIIRISIREARLGIINNSIKKIIRIIATLVAIIGIIETMIIVDKIMSSMMIIRTTEEDIIKVITIEVVATRDGKIKVIPNLIIRTEIIMKIGDNSRITINTEIITIIRANKTMADKMITIGEEATITKMMIIIRIEVATTIKEEITIETITIKELVTIINKTIKAIREIIEEINTIILNSNSSIITITNKTSKVDKVTIEEAIIKATTSPINMRTIQVIMIIRVTVLNSKENLNSIEVVVLVVIINLKMIIEK